MGKWANARLSGNLLGIALSITGLSSFMAPAYASVPEFDVDGVKLGMSPSQVTSILSQSKPTMMVHAYKYRAGDTGETYIGAIIGEHRMAPSRDDNVLIVLFTRIDDKAFEIQHQVRYPSGLTTAALEQAIQAKYGHGMQPLIPGMQINAMDPPHLRLDYDQQGQLQDRRGPCASTIAQATGGPWDVPYQPFPTMVDLFTQYVPDCAVTLDIGTLMQGNSSNIVDVVTQTLFDQHAMAVDVEKSKAADQAAAAAKQRSAEHAAQAGQPSL